MARRRSRSDSDELFDALSEAPWWVSIVVGVVVFLVLRYVLPPLFGGNAIAGPLTQLMSEFAWFALAFVAPAIASAVRSRSRRRMLDRQSGIESIRALPWKQFEHLLGEAYRRQGFTVFENEGVGPDGGIDLTIRRAGETYLVQAKQWRTYKVGVKVVREMLGLVAAHGARGAIVVSSGSFTKEAMDFAARNPVELVDGDALLAMVRAVQAGAPVPTATTPGPAPVAPLRACPSCGGELVLRTAKRGANAGGQFWGCSGYPKCRHTQPSEG